MSTQLYKDSSTSDSFLFDANLSFIDLLKDPPVVTGELPTLENSILPIILKDGQRITVKVEDLHYFVNTVNKLLKDTYKINSCISFAELQRNLKLDKLDFAENAECTITPEILNVSLVAPAINALPEEINFVSPSPETLALQSTQILNPPNKPDSEESYIAFKKAIVSVKPMLDLTIQELKPDIYYSGTSTKVSLQKYLPQNYTDYSGFNSLTFSEVAVQNVNFVITKNYIGDGTNTVNFNFTRQNILDTSRTNPEYFGAYQGKFKLPMIECAKIKLNKNTVDQLITPQLLGAESTLKRTQQLKSEYTDYVDLDYKEDISKIPVIDTLGFKAIQVVPDLVELSGEKFKEILKTAESTDKEITPTSIDSDSTAIGFSRIIIPSDISFTDIKPQKIEFSLANLCESANAQGTWSTQTALPNLWEAISFTGLNSIEKTIKLNSALIAQNFEYNVDLKASNEEVDKSSGRLDNKIVSKFKIEIDPIINTTFNDETNNSKVKQIFTLPYLYDTTNSNAWPWQNNNSPIRIEFSPKGYSSLYTYNKQTNEYIRQSTQKIWNDSIFALKDKPAVFTTANFEMPAPYDVDITRKHLATAIKNNYVYFTISNTGIYQSSKSGTTLKTKQIALPTFVDNSILRSVKIDIPSCHDIKFPNNLITALMRESVATASVTPATKSITLSSNSASFDVASNIADFIDNVTIELPSTKSLFISQSTLATMMREKKSNTISIGAHSVKLDLKSGWHSLNTISTDFMHEVVFTPPTIRDLEIKKPMLATVIRNNSVNIPDENRIKSFILNGKSIKLGTDTLSGDTADFIDEIKLELPTTTYKTLSPAALKDILYRGISTSIYAHSTAINQKDIGKSGDFITSVSLNPPTLSQYQCDVNTIKALSVSGYTRLRYDAVHNTINAYIDGQQASTEKQIKAFNENELITEMVVPILPTYNELSLGIQGYRAREIYSKSYNDLELDTVKSGLSGGYEIQLSRSPFIDDRDFVLYNVLYNKAKFNSLDIKHAVGDWWYQDHSGQITIELFDVYGNRIKTRNIQCKTMRVNLHFAYNKIELIDPDGKSHRYSETLDLTQIKHILITFHND